MDAAKIGEAIRYLRRREGYTQKDIADFLQISYQAVSKWERGLCIPDAMYLSKLAEHLNVDLDDLLEGNITYLDDEWWGILLLPDVRKFSKDTILKMCDFLLSYFMLAGIRHIIIQTDSVVKTEIKGKYRDGSGWGIRIEYVDNLKDIDILCNIMLVSSPIFLYGSNLTKYFWRAMGRRDGVSVLTIEVGEEINRDRVTYNKQHLIESLHSGGNSVIPILFVPHHFLQACSHGFDSMVENEQLFAEPTSRGLISRMIRSDADLNEVLQFKSLVESMTGEKMYDLNEIAEARGLKKEHSE